jgi:hypothetical protein
MALFENLSDYYTSTAYSNLVKLRQDVARMKVGLISAYLFSGQCSIINGVSQYPTVLIEGVYKPLPTLLFVTGHDYQNNKITIADTKGYYTFDIDVLIAILDTLEVLEFNLKVPVRYIREFWYQAENQYTSNRIVANKIER